MNKKTSYYQMLVSPHVGGGAKLAIEIHKYIITTRGPRSRLLLPKGAEAEQSAIDQNFAFIGYDLEHLVSQNRFISYMENLYLYVRTTNHNCGIIHIHSPFVYGAARPLFIASKLKTVLHIHLDFTYEQLKWALKLPPDLILICADFMRSTVERTMSEAKFKNSKIQVILNAVDTKCFFSLDRAVAKAQLGVKVDLPLLMVIANLAPHKGQETAIRTVALLKANGFQVKLWIVGEERAPGQNYLDKLKSLSMDLRVADLVDFVGFRKDIPQLLQATDFLLLPSTNEGLPLVILEAQASKSLVLAAPTAGVPEVIKDGLTGYLIAADNYQGYAERIAFLLTNPIQISRVVEAAYQHVCENHNMKQYCETVLQEYDELLSNR